MALTTVSNVSADTMAVVQHDSLPENADTIIIGEQYTPIVLQPPVEYVGANPTETGDGMSWIYTAVLVIFCVSALWMRNSKMMSAVLRNLTEVRLRQNVFDDTAHETGFMILLNLQWVLTAGILVWLLLCKIIPDSEFNSLSLHLHQRPALTITLCCAATAAYEIIMGLVYGLVGIVFTDRDKTRLWIKGYGASQALTGIWFLCVALPGLFYPHAVDIFLALAAIGLCVGKAIFIFKGFRIFFTQMSSWILFLYYLCSLEIIPLILTLYAAVWLCTLV